MNRLRAKIDKEIENKDIKKKLRNVQAKVHSNLLFNPNQANFDRAGNSTGKSSARRSVGNRSNNLMLHSERQVSPPSNRMTTACRPMLYDDSSAYSKSVNVYMPPQQQQQQQQQKQPLSMYMTSSFNQKIRCNNRQKKSKAKTPCILPAISDNELIEEIDKSSRSSKSMHEDAYNSRIADSLSSSSSDVHSLASSSRSPLSDVQIKTNLLTSESNRSLECLDALQSTYMDVASLSSGSSTYLNLDLDLCSLDLSSPKSSDDVFHMAPLIPAPSATLSTSSSARPQIDTSATLIRKFRNALAREERSMPEDEIKVVKDVLKTDKRVNLLKAQEPDSNLFKDILKTQLDEIVKSEKVVTNALRMLGASPQVIEMTRPIEVYNVAPIYGPLDNRKCCSPRGKTTQSKSMPYSSDSSPRCYSSLDGREAVKRRNVATDTASMKAVTPRNEAANSNADKKSLKNVKLVKTNVAPHDEFEAFIRSTLPFKRKTPTSTPKPKPKPTGEQVLHRQQTHPDDLMSKKSKGSAETHSNLSNTHARRPQVDVTFKNVPSVEKEILILKALGKRLEETLKRSVSEPSLSDRGEKPEGEDLPACSSTSSLTRELKRIDESIQVFPGRRTSASASTSAFASVKHLSIVMDVVPYTVCRVGFFIFSQGVRLEIGIVNEFVIVSKTVNELLNEPTSEFFIANENKPGGLSPIPFQQVAGQPQVLMRYLKPKNPATPFNILDHDSIFFNSFLLPSLKSKAPAKLEKIDAAVSAEIEIPVKEQPKIVEHEIKATPPTICEGGDSLMVASEGLPPLIIEPCCSKYTIEKKPITRRSHSKKAIKVKPPPVELPVSATPSQRTLTRARMRRVVTPMPCDAFDDPKNNLVKTILVGAVQVSIFLVMIMAITYPDIKC